MTDRYIDQDEVKIYGKYAVKQIRQYIVPLEPAFKDALLWLANELDHATDAVAANVQGSRGAAGSVRSATTTKGSALGEGKALLVRFGSHLDGHKPGTVDSKLFFGPKGTASGIGASAPRVALAVNHIAAELAKADCKVNAKEQWAAEFAAADTALSLVLEHSDNNRTDRANMTPTLASTYRVWAKVYSAAKSLVDSVLTMTGEVHLMPYVFHDLAVPANAKVTEPPPDVAPPTPTPVVTPVATPKP